MARAAISSRGLGIVALTLQFTPANGVGAISAEFASGNTALAGAGFRQRDAAESLVPAGKFTFVLPAPPAVIGAATPEGNGYGIATLSAKGAFKVIGKLPDGTAYSASGKVGGDGAVPLYLPLYAAKGLLAGSLSLRNGSLGGDLQWHAPATVNYPLGISADLNTEGAVFISPEPGRSALHGSSASIAYQFTAGTPSHAPLVDKTVGVPGTDKTLVALPNAEKLSIKINRTTGLVTGSFRDLSVGRNIRKFSGVVLQDSGTASGGYLDTFISAPFDLSETSN